MKLLPILALVSTSLLLSNCTSDGRCVFAPKKKEACSSCCTPAAKKTTASACCATPAKKK